MAASSNLLVTTASWLDFWETKAGVYSISRKSYSLPSLLDVMPLYISGSRRTKRTLARAKPNADNVRAFRRWDTATWACVPSTKSDKEKAAAGTNAKEEKEWESIGDMFKLGDSEDD